MLNAWFYNVPFQRCSDNMAYANSPHGVGRYPTKNLKDFKKDMDDWFYKNKDQILKIRGDLKRDMPLRMSIFLLVRPDRVWTKNGQPKKFDAQNWCKALIDCFSEIMGMDDRNFWRVEVEKVENDGHTWQASVDQVMINITDYTPRKLSDLKGGSL